MQTSTEFAALFRRDLTRLRQQIESFPDDDKLWSTVAGVENPAGNLALHLEGNLREFIGRQMCGIPFVRVRPREFSDKGLTREELCRRVDALIASLPAAIESMPDGKLAEPFPEEFQGRTLSCRQFLIHLYGHFNYHLGQIDYLRRVLTGSGPVDYARLS